MFQVFDVSTWQATRSEFLGSKEKFWIQPPQPIGQSDRPYLFKIGRPNTGENWAEKISYEIANAVQLPCANYELAIREGIKGVISEQLMPNGASLALGNILLPEIVPGYDTEKEFKQTDYRLSRALRVINEIRELEKPRNSPIQLPRPVDFFVGYLLLDVLISNTDRHHANWGVVVERQLGARGQFEFWLAPTFDHASSLGHAETDEKRKMRLTTRDNRASMIAYVTRAKTAFYDDENPDKPLTLRQLLKNLNYSERNAVHFWGARFSELTPAFFQDLFNNISREWITEATIEFAIKILTLNQQAIHEAIND